MKRYTKKTFYDAVNEYDEMVEDPEGEYVKYNDVVKNKSERENMQFKESEFKFFTARVFARTSGTGCHLSEKNFIDHDLAVKWIEDTKGKLIVAGLPVYNSTIDEKTVKFLELYDGESFDDLVF